MERLPSFSGLTAFYAAARRGTLTAAAAELNVSQPAVSRRIAMLEADLGSPLFDRSHKPVRMTQSGRDLLRALQGGFGQIEAAVAQIRQAAQGKVVTVTAPSGFVAFWLIPQLGELEAAFEDVTIRIISQEYGEATRPGDIAIRFGLPEDGTERRLLGDGVFPAASPLYLDRREMSGSDYDFARMTLLTMESARSQWHDWPSWFRSVGMSMPQKARVLDFSSYAMLVNAALAGQGVCLCWDGVLDRFLEAGALVRLEGPEAVSSRGYFMAAREGLAAAPHVRGILGWILEKSHK
ncbi:LysR family transcriptional regulator [Ruegeria pomeroyi]|uniref:Transcriptional regulator, LysR family n=2 Tax=Ruegeria pomeroyi TaxID=89184 RepID=Q5LW88_RUEPO|nr:LysR family transcriptional regulator [Ruegeria pomeroyi]AAV93772.1 transcriptional regulator, LysR family [Ruegeria pomeroyi DSS-3]HCE71250.1 LysR family transcriptional regulator [Ruegeria sp.]NVK98628.1 LysR family transcriptional regulator [Ruegeria pomeroyi]NVL03863.1 LysR family transcriptional regulator [Ruegeria pomeroyi]QWV07363.1 LysR family transcriptional regulator [Ruegeria pomeroyi]